MKDSKDKVLRLVCRRAQNSMFCHITAPRASCMCLNTCRPLAASSRRLSPCPVFDLWLCSLALWFTHFSAKGEQHVSHTCWVIIKHNCTRYMPTGRRIRVLCVLSRTFSKRSYSVFPVFRATGSDPEPPEPPSSFSLSTFLDMISSVRELNQTEIRTIFNVPVITSSPEAGTEERSRGTWISRAHVAN